MTIPEFLQQTTVPKAEIAQKCGVDVSQVYRWENNNTVPSGLALMRLIELSAGLIKADDVPPTKRGQKRSKRSAA